jgi:hypothetical protein
MEGDGMNSRLRYIHNISLWTGGLGLLTGGTILLIAGEIGWGMLSLACGACALAAIWLDRLRDKSN